MLARSRYIVVEGPIGAGKTSLARRLAQRLRCRLLLEEPERNPFLGRFYQDMVRHALPVQLAFLFQRLEQLEAQQHVDSANSQVVADFLFEKDALFAGLILQGDELALYEQIVARLRIPAPTPDLVIYLQAPPEVLMQRVRQRAAEAERPITETYLERVAQRYASFFHHFDAAPLFIVQAGRLNPIDDDDDFELLWQRLNAMRSYREYFGYAD
ncbi:MAG: deoxynucleoside kinase [Betaproteobacteria bacterium]|nr:deoxynucleoside kinase [Betaproteobacteria bacterium]